MDQFSHNPLDNDMINNSNIDLTSSDPSARFRSTQPFDGHDASGFISQSSGGAMPAPPPPVDNNFGLGDDQDRIYRSIGAAPTMTHAPQSSFWDHALGGANNAVQQAPAKELGGSFSALSIGGGAAAGGGAKDLTTSVKTIGLSDASSFIRQLSTASSVDDSHVYQSFQQKQQNTPLSQALPPLSAFSCDSPLHQLQHARALPQPSILESSHVVLSHPPSVVFGKMLAVFASYGIARNRATMPADDVNDNDEEDDKDDVAMSISHDVNIVKLVTSKYKVKAAVVPCTQFSSCTFQCQLFEHAGDKRLCVLEFQRRHGCPFTFHSVFQQLIRIIDTKEENACTRAPFTPSPAFMTLDMCNTTPTITSAQQEAATAQTMSNLMSMSTSDMNDVALEGMQGMARLSANDGVGVGESSSSSSTSAPAVVSSSPQKEQQCLDLLTKVLGNQNAPFAACTAAQLDSVTSILATTSQVPSFQAKLLEQNHHLLHALARLLNNANISSTSQRNIVLSLRQISEHSTSHASALVRTLKMAPSQYNQVIALLALFAASTKDVRLQESAKAALRNMQVV